MMTPLLNLLRETPIRKVALLEIQAALERPWAIVSLEVAMDSLEGCRIIKA